MKHGNTIEVLGVKIHRLSVDRMLKQVEDFVRSGEYKTILYVNIHCLNLAQGDEEYKGILNSASLVYCDGEGVRLGARILGYGLPHRMTGADWIYDLGRLCQKQNLSLFFLGSESGVAEKATVKLKEQFPRLTVSGAMHGYFDKDNCSEVIETVNNARPDILLVGLGSPLQEKWIYQYRNRLKVPVCWAVGALFDFVTLKQKRAPDWMLNRGLEWLFRLVCEPKRLWRRYLIGNSVFMMRIFMQRLRNK